MPWVFRGVVIGLVVLLFQGCRDVIDNEPSQAKENDLEGATYPPNSLDDTLFSVKAGRTLIGSTVLQGLALNRWPLSVNKGLVLAVPGHADMYSLGANTGSRLEGFSLSLMENGFYTAWEDSSQLTQAVYEIQGEPGVRSLRSVFVGTAGLMMKFDTSGTLWVFHPSRQAYVPVSLQSLESSDYDWLSRGDSAKEFLVGEVPYVWRYFFKSGSAVPLGVLVTPKGGMRGTEIELGILDFQSASGSPLNPIEHYLGTRQGNPARIDHTFAFPEGVNLRTTNALGQRQLVFYRGIFKNVLSIERLDRKGNIQPGMNVYDVANEVPVPVSAPDITWNYQQ